MYHDWQLEKFLLFGKGWRVWFIVFPNDLVIMRWVPAKRIESDKTIEEKFKKDTARMIWRLLTRCGFRRVR